MKLQLKRHAFYHSIGCFSESGPYRVTAYTRFTALEVEMLPHIWVFHKVTRNSLMLLSPHGSFDALYASTWV